MNFGPDAVAGLHGGRELLLEGQRGGQRGRGGLVEVAPGAVWDLFWRKMNRPLVKFTLLGVLKVKVYCSVVTKRDFLFRQNTNIRWKCCMFSKKKPEYLVIFDKFVKYKF